MALSKEKKASLVKKFAKNEKDTGSMEVQIALLTEQINALTLHLKNNHKDHSSHRGLMRLVGQRKSLLNYLEEHDRDAYIKLIKDLRLRK
ncbi:MAG: 30S ribosomal protein S15 [Bacilli bacterium]|nr:30S ribosomal protein S15 [Bacilli bacterium]